MSEWIAPGLGKAGLIPFNWTIEAPDSCNGTILLIGPTAGLILFDLIFNSIGELAGCAITDRFSQNTSFFLAFVAVLSRWLECTAAVLNHLVLLLQ